MPITDQQKLNTLRLMQSGRDLPDIAHLVHLPEFVVEEIAEEYSWPNEEKMRQGVFDLTRNLLDHKHSPPKTVTGPPPPVTPEAAPASDGPAAPIPPMPGRPDPSSIEALLEAAAKSPHARIRNLGTKIRGSLGDLDARLCAEREESAARLRAAEQRRREREEAEKAEQQRLERIAELEREIADLRKRKDRRTAGGRMTMVAPCREAGCEDREPFDSLQGLNMHRKRRHDLPFLRAEEVRP